MKFLKVFVPVLVLCFLFAFFGGWQLLNVSGGIYITAAIAALVISLVVFAFLVQDEKIEKLEKRVKELEAKNR